MIIACFLCMHICTIYVSGASRKNSTTMEFIESDVVESLSLQSLRIPEGFPNESCIPF